MTRTLLAEAAKRVLLRMGKKRGCSCERKRVVARLRAARPAVHSLTLAAATGRGSPGVAGANSLALAERKSPAARLLPRVLPRRDRRGFTVIELLVAAGITALIAGFIAVIVRNVSVVWTRAGNRLGADAQARIVMDQLQLDLQGAMFRDDGNVWMAADLLSTTGNSTLWQPAARNPKPSGGLSLDIPATRAELIPSERGKLENSRFGTAGVWLRFFTTSRGANTASSPGTISAPVAVGYQIIRRFTATNPANTTSLAYVLHRSEVRPVAVNNRPGVFESGYNITAAAYTTSNSATNSGATTGDPRSIQVPGNARNLDSMIADNVIDFGVRCYVRDAQAPGGLRLIFPANANGALTNSPQPLRVQLPSSTQPTAPDYNARFLCPDVIDVMVRILTEEGAATLANFVESNRAPLAPIPAKYNNNAQEWWWGVARENSRVYTRRIVLGAKSS
jgi:type II secretory pathway component PulJ